MRWLGEGLAACTVCVGVSCSKCLFDLRDCVVVFFLDPPLPRVVVVVPRLGEG